MSACWFRKEDIITHDFLSTKDNNALIRKQVDDDAECEPDVGQSKPGEDQRENVILEEIH